MKRKIFICLFVLIIFGTFMTSAVNPLIFTAINDVIQLNPTPNTVPIRVGGTVYVLPEVFTRALGLKSFYNSQLNQLLIYNSDANIVFDLTNSEAYDESQNFVIPAIRMNGKTYVPAKAVCDKDRKSDV